MYVVDKVKRQVLSDLIPLHYTVPQLDRNAIVYIYIKAFR